MTFSADRDAQRALLLDEWLEVRREINEREARASALLAQRVALMKQDVAEQPLHRESIWRSMIAEYSAAGHVSKGSMEFAFTDAHALATDALPVLRDAFAAGKITASHVREILRAASPVTEAIGDGTVDPETLSVYEMAGVVFAEAESPMRTRAHVREVAAALAGVTVVERYKRARSERSVTMRSVGDGLALLQVVLPEYLAVAIMDRLTQMARHQKQHTADREPTLRTPEEDDADAARTPRTFDPDYDDPDDARDVIFSDSAIFSEGDTFTRDPFDNGEGYYHEGHYVAPDDDPFGGDDDAYWAHVDRMIADGPQPIKIPADERTLDQIRTDLLTDLLLSTDPAEVHGNGLSNITARINVTISATTLTGDDDRPAQLDGHGELHPDTARTLAGGTTGWTRLFLDPTGLVTETDTYSPTEPMRRFLRARDQHCRFPGCRMPVHRSELDHTHDHARGGPTSTTNLAHLCKTHHALKHPDVDDRHRWRARQLPNWDLEWTSPTGRVHTDTPPRRVMFIPTEHIAPQATADAPF